MTCKNLHHRYVTTDCRGPYAAMRYFQGFKRCRECEVLIKTESKNCPCCGYKLAVRPFSGRARRYNLALRAQVK